MFDGRRARRGGARPRRPASPRRRAYAHGLSDIAEHPDDEDAIEALDGPHESATRRTSANGCDAFRALLACLPIALRATSPMQFSKWHGLGNDYLLVERAELAFPLTPERVQKICDYHFGVGSDGIVEVTVRRTATSPRS